MNKVDSLLAVEAIRNLKSRYFRLLDCKEWDGFESLFAPDAVLDMRSGPGTDQEPAAVISGAREIAMFVRRSVDPLTTIHHGHTPEIRLEWDTMAHGIWAMEDWIFVPDNVAMPFRTLHGHGHYHDTYVCLDGSWKIKSSRLSRLRVEVT